MRVRSEADDGTEVLRIISASSPAEPNPSQGNAVNRPVKYEPDLGKCHSGKLRTCMHLAGSAGQAVHRCAAPFRLRTRPTRTQGPQRHKLHLADAVTAAIGLGNKELTVDRQSRLGTGVIALGETGDAFEPVHQVCG